MKKLIFFGCIALAASAGLIIGAIEGSWGLAILFGLKLSVIGMAIGALLSKLWRKSKSPEQEEGERDIADREQWERLTRTGSHDTSAEELTANYWRDKGHPPFMNPEDHDPRG